MIYLIIPYALLINVSGSHQEVARFFNFFRRLAKAMDMDINDREFTGLFNEEEDIESRTLHQ